MRVGQIDVPMEQVEAFCRRWKITELAFFGSVLRDDFRPDSDVDVLVTFEPDARWSLLDLAGMEIELQDMFGRRVDLVERPAVEQSYNVIRRRRILESARRFYAAR
jgi:predicted nucleotidyltransferase